MALYVEMWNNCSRACEVPAMHTCLVLNQTLFMTLFQSSLLFFKKGMCRLTVTTSDSSPSRQCQNSRSVCLEACCSVLAWPASKPRCSFYPLPNNTQAAATAPLHTNHLSPNDSKVTRLCTFKIHRKIIIRIYTN